ncbi:MAG: outer membrane PBP1 activator LpoA protein [Thalassolituus sp.]|jgi:outer membrane PBP1 activator LpoA protein
MRDYPTEKRLLKDRLSTLSLKLPTSARSVLSAAVVVIGVTLTGCATSPQNTTTEQQTFRPENSAQLEIIRQQLEAGEFGNASNQLQLLDASALSPLGRAEWHLLSADTAIGYLDTDAARYHLEKFNELINSANQDQEYRAALLEASLLELDGEFFQAARERDFVSAMLPSHAQDANHDQLWADLMQLPNEEMQVWAEKVPGTRFGGWLELAAISKNYQMTLDEQLAGVRNWQTTHPGHPASLRLPGVLTMLEDIAANRPQQVTLLLPLSGRLARTGEAIRDGFMAAYFESFKKGSQVPAITIIDHATQESMDQAYAGAIQAGSQWLVGPLNKADVEELQSRPSLPLPTLALNYASNDNSYATSPPELFQFGLSAEDEAVQIAEQAWADGHRRALVMIPEGNWGERIYQAFEEKWLALGGEIEETQHYPRVKDYNPNIKSLLNVDSSQARYKSIRSLMRRSVDFEPRRRQDADWLFLVALPDQARQIKPTLAFNFARDLPVYSTSHVFSGEIDLRKDRDLNGIYFCDTPWLLRDSELKDEVEASVQGGQGSYARLYAMGVDAFRLIARVKQLEAFPESRIYGSTGALTLDPQHRIHRKTECTSFRSGEPIKL